MTLTAAPDYRSLNLDSALVDEVLAVYGGGLWEARSMTNLLARDWVHAGLTYRLHEAVTAPLEAGQSEVARAMQLPTHRQRGGSRPQVQHRYGALYVGDGSDQQVAAELYGVLNLGHTCLVGAAAGRAIAVSGRPIGETLYDMGATRHTTMVEAIDMPGRDGQRLVIEVTAYLTIGRPVAWVRERLPEWVVARALARWRPGFRRSPSDRSY